MTEYVKYWAKQKKSSTFENIHATRKKVRNS